MAGEIIGEDFVKQFDIKTRQKKNKDKMVEYLGEMLMPETDGFEQINLDMTFTYLGNWELHIVDELSRKINICRLYNLKQSEFLLRGDLATLLNSRRSRNAKSMDMFTTITTKSEQKFEDSTHTPQKAGFSFFGGGKQK